MNKQTEALKMVTDILDDELWFPNKYPDEAIPVCFIEALKACKEALEQPARLVSYAHDKSTCTLNIDGEEVYFNREYPEQSPIAYIKQGSDGYPKLVFNGRFEYASITAKQNDIALFANPAKQPAQEPVMFDIHKKADELLKTQREINRKYGKAPSWQGLSDDEKISIKRQINNAFNEGFEKGKNMSLVASIPLNLIKLESQSDTRPAKQQEQEPVAWMHRHEGEITEFNDFQSCDKCEPLYTHPAPSWKGLSDNKIINLYAFYGSDTEEAMLEFARAIEQALKDRNT